MMDDLEKLARVARREEPPRVSVAPAVMARIREEDALVNRPLAFLAAGSLVAAGVTVSMSLTVVQILSDPLAALFDVAPMLVQ